MLARFRRDYLAIGRALDDLFLQAAAIEIRNGFVGGDHLDEFWIERFPVPFRAGQIGLWRQRRLIDVIAADHRAAARRILHHLLRSVDVAGLYIDALIDQAVGRFGFL